VALFATLVTLAPAVIWYWHWLAMAQLGDQHLDQVPGEVLELLKRSSRAIGATSRVLVLGARPSIDGKSVFSSSKASSSPLWR
jgi:hypothetical protein